ncbi:MAG: PorP/SprF family type IX secretion system membrane protein [Bacteroidales bacterium]|nr:PorP/SprF family type IX secretion system membrane protein [Bacteroidales bacterium]
MGLFCNSFSQDIHFTLFNNSPLFLNPANTGNFEGNWRLTGTYRDQWRAISEPFTTATMSFDMNFFVKGHKINGGLYFINDNSGAIELSLNELLLSAAYEKSIGKNIFRAGIQAGYAYRAYGKGNYSFPSGYSREEGIYVGINNPAEKKGYLDINIGALWRTSINKFEPEAGFSLSHINYPNESFYNDEKGRLPIRYNIHGRVKANISDNLFVFPSIIYITRRAANAMVAGTDIGFKNFGKRSPVKMLSTGVYFRNGLQNNPDAISVTGGATVGRIDISICYDYNISGLKKATGNQGAFEISFGYRSISTVLNSYSIPCERF